MGGAPRMFALHYEGSSKYSWRLVIILEPWTANSKPFFTADRFRTSTEPRSASLRPPDLGERNFQAAHSRFGKGFFAGREWSLCLESGFFTACAFRKLDGG